MSQLASRQATPQDLTFITRIHHKTLRSYIETIWGWDRAKWDSFVERWFKPERVRIIQRGSEDIGILPNWQGMGFGSRVISGVLAEAENQGLPVTLEVPRTNPRAKKLYERLGFTVTGNTETHFRMTLTR